MNEQLRAKCDLLTENRDIINKTFKMQFSHAVIAAALIHTDKGLTADKDRLKECRKILKKNQGVFSDFRSYAELTVISKMAVSDDPEAFIRNVADIYKTVRSGKFFTSTHMALAAMSISDLGKKAQAEEVAEKTRELLERLRKLHPFLASQEDLSFLALLAMTDKSVDRIVEEVEECFGILKEKFPLHGNAVYSLCQILTIKGGKPEDKCAKVMEIYQAMKSKKVKYGKEYELASLGVLIDLDIDIDSLVKEVQEASAYLKKHRGFGNFTIGKTSRNMFAALLAAGIFASEDQAGASSDIGGAIAAAIVQQIVMMIVISAAASSAASASSSH